MDKPSTSMEEFSIGEKQVTALIKYKIDKIGRHVLDADIAITCGETHCIDHYCGIGADCHDAITALRKHISMCTRRGFIAKYGDEYDIILNKLYRKLLDGGKIVLIKDRNSISTENYGYYGLIVKNKSNNGYTIKRVCNAEEKILNITSIHLHNREGKHIELYKSCVQIRDEINVYTSLIDVNNEEVFLRYRTLSLSEINSMDKVAKTLLESIINEVPNDIKLMVNNTILKKYDNDSVIYYDSKYVNLVVVEDPNPNDNSKYIATIKLHILGYHIGKTINCGSLYNLIDDLSRNIYNTLHSNNILSIPRAYNRCLADFDRGMLNGELGEMLIENPIL